VVFRFPTSYLSIEASISYCVGHGGFAIGGIVYKRCGVLSTFKIP
jgi:hypothetical protein